MNNVDTLLVFAKLTNQLSATERFINLPKIDRRENVSEHSAQLALVAWFLLDKNDLPLDRCKVLQYALIHDIVEANTGDFPTHLADFDFEKKQKLESQSIKYLKKEIPFGEALWESYDEYSKLDSEESKFVYALDKLLPIINIYLDSCKEWTKKTPKENARYFDMLLKKVELSPVVIPIFAEICKRAFDEHPELVGDSGNRQNAA